jgi:nicotinamidase-related amidase
MTDTESGAVPDYAISYKLGISPEAGSTALVLVNMQQGVWASPATSDSRLLGRIGNCLTEFRAHRWPVIHVLSGSAYSNQRDVPAPLRRLTLPKPMLVGTEPYQSIPGFAPLEDELQFRKTTFSAFASTGIENALRALSMDFVVFAGAFTNTSVDATAADAADLQFRTMMIGDCCLGETQDKHEGALRRFNRFYGRVARAGEFLTELARTDKSPVT